MAERFKGQVTFEDVHFHYPGMAAGTLYDISLDVVCIARAILTDPQLLIFDEATANIDTQTEQLVQAAIDDLLRDRTVFVIAHRLSTIRHADKICVLRGGGILEQGSHDELMDKDGSYAGLIRS